MTVYIYPENQEILLNIDHIHVCLYKQIQPEKKDNLLEIERSYVTMYIYPEIQHILLDRVIIGNDHIQLSLKPGYILLDGDFMSEHEHLSWKPGYFT